ncbi:hypothetical protein OG474_18875 [Kribbella sp. NBC_01505]|uniref:hypothetical protein n=1 Tax=Kribbella sp. NBC_01505 TaxID=2903580 RepID=UPI0038698062
MKYLDRALCSMRHLDVQCSVLPTDGPYAESKEYCLGTRPDVNRDAEWRNAPVGLDESRV